MRYGHPPAAIDDYCVADIRNFMNALPAIREQESPFTGDKS